MSAFWASPPGNHSNPQSQQMMQNQSRSLGMTSAISTAMPKPIDLLRTKELAEALAPHGVSESDDELNHRCPVKAH